MYFGSKKDTKVQPFGGFDLDLDVKTIQWRFRDLDHIYVKDFHSKAVLKDTKVVSCGESVLFRTLSPYWRVCQGIGMLPFSINPKGNLSVRFVSLVLLYSVCIAVLIDVASALTIVQRIKFILNDKITFQLKIFYVSTMLNVVPLVLIPVTRFKEIYQFVAFMQQWTTFENNFNEVCKQPLEAHPRLFYICLAAVTSCALYGIVVPSWFFFTTNDGLWFELPLYGLVVFLGACEAPFWIFLNMTFKYTCQQLLHNFYQVPLSLKSCSAVVRKYRFLWADLRELVNCCFCVLSYTRLISLTTNFVIVVLTLYAALAGVLEEGLTPRRKMLLSIAPSILITWYIVVNNIHSIQDVVGRDFMHAMYIRRRPFSSYPTNVANEMLYKEFTHSNVQVTANGYLIMDRTFLVSFGSLMVTYLLILIQFEGYSESMPSNTTETFNTATTSP